VPAFANGGQRVKFNRVPEGVHRKAGSNAAVPDACSAIAVIVDQRVLSKPSIQC